MDAKQKAEKLVALAKHIAELDHHRNQAFAELTGILDGGKTVPAPKPAAEAPKAEPKPRKRRRKTRRGPPPVADGRSDKQDPKYPAPEGQTRRIQVLELLRSKGPLTSTKIMRENLMPPGSVGYTLRMMLVDGTLVKDGVFYKIAEGK